MLPRVFGIASLSEIEAEAPSDLAAIVDVGERTYADRVAGKTFAVRARRVGSHSFSSRDVNYELGAALNRYAEVDLDHPPDIVSGRCTERFATSASRGSIPSSFWPICPRSVEPC